MRNLLIYLAAIFFALVVAPAAWAQGTSVTVDPEPYLQVIVGVVSTFALAALAYIRSKLPEKLAVYFDQIQVDKLLEKALGYGAARIKGAGWAKPVKVDVANPWIAMAIEYIDDRAPAFLEKYGRSALEKMLLARIPLDQAEAVKPGPLASLAPSA